MDKCSPFPSVWSDAAWLKPFLTTVLLFAMVGTNLIYIRLYGNLETVFGVLKLLTVLGLVRWPSPSDPIPSDENRLSPACSLMLVPTHEATRLGFVTGEMWVPESST